MSSEAAKYIYAQVTSDEIHKAMTYTADSTRRSLEQLQRIPAAALSPDSFAFLETVLLTVPQEGTNLDDHLATLVTNFSIITRSTPSDWIRAVIQIAMLSGWTECVFSLSSRDLIAMLRLADLQTS